MNMIGSEFDNERIIDSKYQMKYFAEDFQRAKFVKTKINCIQIQMSTKEFEFSEKAKVFRRNFASFDRLPPPYPP